MALVRRFTSMPTNDVLLQIEAIDIIDLTPQSPVLGVGTGTMLCVGEFEDGPFATGGDAVEFAIAYRNKGPQEIFGSDDMRARFGGFGFTYATTPSQNPCARQHLFEFWNGNGFLKLKFCRFSRLLLARVDTSVGTVGFSPLASITGGIGTFALAVGQQIAVTTDVGGPASSTAITAVRATHVGGAFAASGYLGGETITIAIDHGPGILVTFQVGDQTRAQVAARINLTLGFACATDNGAGITLVGQIFGTGGQIVLTDTTPGALASIGLVAGTDNGTGSVANLAAVTAAEVVTIINTTAALTAIDVKAYVDSTTGALTVFRSLGTGTINITSGVMALALGLAPLGTTVTAGAHAAGTIPAGTRVQDDATNQTWVTMQTLVIAAGTAAAPNLGPHLVKIRPAQDDGSGTAVVAGIIDTVQDQPSFSAMSVSNPANVSAALTEAQLDVVYGNAFDATLNPANVVREANFIICARSSATVKQRIKANAIAASAAGFFGRKAIIRGSIGWTQSQAITDVALNRSERVFYTYPGLTPTIPEISILGAAVGGPGFTDSGVITVGADGALGTIDCLLAPEEDPGQATGLIDQFTDVEPQSPPFTIDSYKAFKAAGICAPRLDQRDGLLFQSGVTTSLIASLTDQNRMKMSDYIGDSLAIAFGPYSKTLATIARRDGVESAGTQFLSGLQGSSAPGNTSLQRIDSFIFKEISTVAQAALGIFLWAVSVKTLQSFKALGFVLTVGPGVITVVPTNP